MVNIQIRGNLIDIEMISISKYNFDNFLTKEFSNDHIKDFLSNSSDCTTIYKSTLPIIEQNSELQVTSFENDNFYDDGYTFLRSNLNDVNYKDVNVLEDPSIRIKLSEHSNWPTIPQLFVKGQLIGGADITIELHQNGQLLDILDISDK